MAPLAGPLALPGNAGCRWIRDGLVQSATMFVVYATMFAFLLHLIMIILAHFHPRCKLFSPHFRMKHNTALCHRVSENSLAIITHYGAQDQIDGDAWDQTPNNSGRYAACWLR